MKKKHRTRTSKKDGWEIPGFRWQSIALFVCIGTIWVVGIRKNFMATVSSVSKAMNDPRSPRQKRPPTHTHTHTERERERRIDNYGYSNLATTQPKTNNTNENLKEKSDNSVCSALRFRTTATIWRDGLQSNRIQESLLAAPDNVNGEITDKLRNLTARVLDILPPQVLQRSVHHYTTSRDSDDSGFGHNYGKKVQQIIQKLHKRETVNILVFGGSPTAGSNCYRNKRLKKNGKCAWPGHMEAFLNAALGFDAVQVVNYAIGASDSSLAVAIMTHGLIPQSMKGAGQDVDVDMVIYAYGVNDFHSQINTKGSYSTDTSFLHRFLMATNDLAPCGGLPPITILLDDLVVNFGRGNHVAGAEVYHSNFEKFAQWHDLSLVSYSSVVKNLLFRDVHEKLLVDWKTDSKHPPRGGHVAIVLTLVFNLLAMVQQHCEDMDVDVVDHKQTTGTPDASSKNVNTTQQKSMDIVLLPPIHQNLGLDSITKSWQENIAKKQQKQNDKCEHGKVELCTFAWVAMRQEKEHNHITDNPTQLVRGESSEWKYDTTWPPDNYGFKPLREHATVHLLVPGRAVVAHDTAERKDVEIQSMSITYMKSYSEKWKDSNLRVDITHTDDEVGMGITNKSTGSANLGSGEYSGYHEIQTSEYYTENIYIHGHQMGRDLNATFQMISGDTFKIIGMTFCGTRTG
mmetsp:Transcript_2048/g.2337  ORF Transcript_2048/g.2337 Transcript_2048/m.2337 type:complete len:684 (+) Transcript_2048:76-2127(+)